jgi:peptidoglycan/xylan/chitin deacetylase (PgdA/CDA1 family)
VSVHDLMPATMPAVRRTLALLERNGVHPVTLLVVPGSGWGARGIDELRALECAGYRLAGHGWQHRAERIRGVRHRLHSLFLSRNVAEHLALERDGVLALMARCRDWFEAQGLAPPGLYVPPAWALGDVRPEDLRRAGLFAHVELFAGVLDTAAGRLTRSPVLGYEADAPIRVPVLRLWNALGRRRAVAQGRIRIGIHPRDIDHPLRDALIADLERFRHYVDYDSDSGNGGDSATSENPAPGIIEPIP